MLQDTGNQREQVVALAADGTELLVKTGVSNQVGLSRQEMDQLRGKVDILTHNHPSGLGIGFADFSIAVDLDARELHAFDRRVRYRLIRSPSGWPMLSDAERDLQRIRTSVRRRLNAALRARTITVQEYSLHYWHDVWTRYAQRQPAVRYLREDRTHEAT